MRDFTRAIEQTSKALALFAEADVKGRGGSSSKQGLQPSTSHAQNVANCRYLLGALYQRSGDLERAHKELLAAVEDTEYLYGEDHLHVAQVCVCGGGGEEREAHFVNACMSMRVYFMLR